MQNAGKAKRSGFECTEPCLGQRGKQELLWQKWENGVRRSPWMVKSFRFGSQAFAFQQLVQSCSRCLSWMLGSWSCRLEPIFFWDFGSGFFMAEGHPQLVPGKPRAQLRAARVGTTEGSAGRAAEAGARGGFGQKGRHKGKTTRNFETDSWSRPRVSIARPGLCSSGFALRRSANGPKSRAQVWSTPSSCCDSLKSSTFSQQGSEKMWLDFPIFFPALHYVSLHVPILGKCGSRW